MTIIRHILVPTDFSETAGRGVSMALELAKAFDVGVTLMHATLLPPDYQAPYVDQIDWPTEELKDHATRALDAAVAGAKARHAKVEPLLMVGDPPARILEAIKATGADLVVMGTHGRRGLARMLIGSVAEKIVRTAPVPVMTVV